MNKAFQNLLLLALIFMFIVQTVQAKSSEKDSLLTSLLVIECNDIAAIKLNVKNENKNVTLSNIVVFFTIDSVSCNGGSNGSVQTSVSGVNPPFTYRWSTGATTPNLTNVSAGSYTVVVKNAVGDSSVATATVEQPDPIQIFLYPQPVTCNGGNDGRMAHEAVGGTNSFDILWSNGQTGFFIENLTAGIYSIRVTDTKGCVKTASDTIKQPPAILITPVITPLSCFSSCAAAINITAANGNAPYTFAWSNAATTPTISALCAGTYNVVVKDALGCTKPESFTISNPIPPVINLGPNRTICANQTITANATVPDNTANYQWTSTVGLTSVQALVTIAQAGTYYVTVTTTGGCITRDTIVVTASKTVVSSDFTVASQVFQNKTVTVVNIATPQPDSIAWIVPNTNSISVITRTPALLQLLFRDTGVYTIAMRANLGNCQSITNKTVKVLMPQAFDTTQRLQDPLIRNFSASPNPNIGQFTVKVNLKENSNIRLRFINVITNVTVNDRFVTGAKDYTLNYNLIIPSGVYVLLLETAKASRVLKLIIN